MISSCSSGASSGSIIFLHIGQAGVQTGSSIWQLFCKEHNLSPDGKFVHHHQNDSDITEQQQADQGTQQKSNPTVPPDSKTKSKFTSENTNVKCSHPHPQKLCVHRAGSLPSPFIENVFLETTTNVYKPRALFIDLEPSAINSSIRNCNSPLKSLFNPEQLIAGKEDCSNIYSRGYYSRGSEFLDVTMNRIGSIVESSRSLQGFVVCRSLGGGTGSGFGSLLLNKLKDAYPKSIRLTLDTLPSSQANMSQIDPYNVLLSANSTINNADISFPFENDALDSICQSTLFIPSPTYENYNRLIAHVTSALFSSLQFPGTTNRSLCELRDSCVMYRRLHYPVLSYVPIVPPEICEGKTISVSSMLDDLIIGRKGQVSQLISETHGQDVLKPEVHMAYNILFRGKVRTTDIKWTQTALEVSEKFSDRIRFIDWAPGQLSGQKSKSVSGLRYKVGLCSKPPGTFGIGVEDLALSNQAAIGIENSTGVSSMWKRTLDKFSDLFKRKAFLHWYTMEGMEESEFTDSQNNVQALIQEYEEILNSHQHKPMSVINLQNARSGENFQNETMSVQQME